MERTYLMIKPDGVQRGICGEIVSRFEKKGLKLVAMKLMVIPKEVAELIPEEVELVFWHYGEAEGCDDYMMKKHNELGRKVTITPTAKGKGTITLEFYSDDELAELAKKIVD